MVSHVPRPALELTIPPTRAGYNGRSQSLWYCDAQEPGLFRWFETVFTISPVHREADERQSLMLPPGENAGGALSNTMTEWQVAWRFTPVDQGDAAGFIERWLEWFADAIAGQMDHPQRIRVSTVSISYPQARSMKSPPNFGSRSRMR